MRTLVAILLVSAVPFSRAWADGSGYHRVQFGDRAPTGNMDYWDDNQNAHQMLMGGSLMDSGSGSLGAALNSTGQNYCNSAPLDASCQAQAGRSAWPSSYYDQQPYPLGVNASNASSQPQVQP